MHSHDDELLVLAEALGEVKTKTEKLEAEFSTQARPLEAATNALSATLSGIKALQFHVIDNNLGALSARVEEMRKAVDEQVGVIALELKKADESNAAKAGQEADALRSEIAGLQAQLGTLGAQFEAQLARVEFAAKEEAKKLQLIPGPAGEAGASLNPRGTFIDGQTYNRLDVVSWLGSSYIATVDGVTEKPSKTSTQWQVLASRGNGGGGTASLNDMLGAPSAGTIVGSEGSSYVRKTLVAGANIAISETPSTITITGTEGQISLEDGSAAAPSLFFTNDPDTGIYRPGSNQVGISLGGSAQAVLTSTTFTVTPNLVVSGTGASSIGGALTVNGGSVTLTGAAYPHFYSDGSSGGAFTIRKAGVAYGVLYGNETNTVLDSGNSANLVFDTGSGTRVTMNSTRVSIPLTTASTSTSTGALVVSGGVGVAKSVNIGESLTVSGNNSLVVLNHNAGANNKSTIESNAGSGANYNGVRVASNWTGSAQGNSGLSSWFVDVGGFDGITYGQDKFFIGRAPAGSTTISQFLQLSNTGNATFAGTLTVSGTAGITGSDFTLGTSGPSVKSTLSARAPRQGLVFDGTAGATVANVPAFGTGDFTVVAFGSTTSLTNTQCIVGASAINGFFMRLDPTTGTLRAGKAGVSDNTSTFSATAGKAFVVAYTRSGATGTFYANGIAAGTASNESASRDYTQAINLIGEFAGGQIFGGYLSVLIYNRALSAAEVVALYEAGAPAAADYNTASNTNLSASAFTNYNTTSFTGVSATGFTAVSSAACEIDSNPNFSLAVGQRIRATFSITVNSGTVQSVLAEQGVGAKSATSATFSTGTYSIELVATGSSSNAAFVFSSVGASNFSVSNFSAVRAGLLLAPDAAQAGGGLVWYDTSGNAANITLPASGVSWNVPTSGKINNAFAITNTTASTSTSTGALVVSGGVGVAGNLNIGGELQISAAYPAFKLTDTNSNSDFSILNDNGRLVVYDETNAAYRLTIGATGGVKIGTTPEDVGANNLTVQGVLAIGNTVTTGVAVVSTHKVQISIGGTTYYLLASNV